VKDPRKTVKAGDIVKVMEVDADRKRIALSMRMSDGLGEKKQGGGERGGAKLAQNHNKQSRSPLRQQSQQAGTGMGALLAQALKK
jgi:uncharacterized protein